ncbi:hypothetical protein PA598K_02595 [Paenibacillus sp. 598K]|uniref:Ig-like domain-containing protein n=1 Tax=Paenibacillus sp. 598K TaxID=1117987 RepID=UPI000FF98E7B|nr:Ig-like domain-containing protein [Paenibacillus sp. 598K]GBF74259.1 hypothetical protein PA598K_02595 [Paenibacillus sp. 598K]
MKAKLITIAAVLALAGILVLIGWIDGRRSVHFSVELQPTQLIANGKDSVIIGVKVTNPDGTPRSGDTLNLIRLSGHGQLREKKIKTNAQGEASFTYYSYRDTSFTPAMLNQVQVVDTSIGKIVGVYKRYVIDIPVVKSDEDNEPSVDKQTNGVQLGGG